MWNLNLTASTETVVVSLSPVSLVVAEQDAPSYIHKAYSQLRALFPDLF